MRTEIVVIGGGIIGCAAAAILADRGARVTLVEARAIGAGASGRNLGAIQHPFDPILAPLFHESLTRYRALANGTGEFEMGAEPAGLLLLNHDADAAAAQARRQQDAVPELMPRLLSADEVVLLEPSLRHGPAAVRLSTGFPIPPASATAAWARLAEERGARILLGSAARPAIEDSVASGALLDDGTLLSADAVLVAAGPWTPALVDPTGGWAPIRATWGVTIQLHLDGAAPRLGQRSMSTGSRRRCSASPARAVSARLARRSWRCVPILRRSVRSSCAVPPHSCLQSTTGRSSGGVCARGPNRSMDDRSSAGRLVWKGSTSAPATGRGASAPDPHPPPSPPEPSWTARRPQPSSRQADRSEPACA